MRLQSCLDRNVNLWRQPLGDAMYNRPITTDVLKLCLQFCQWVYDWHIHRFGLTNLAEINLADLIKSVQVCWKQSTKVTHFGQLTAIIQSRNLPRW